VQNESSINDSIRALRFTRIFAAHRPHTIASADRVVVLDRGTVKQELRVSKAFAESFPRP
jgi:ATP-binding cassette subfamily B protein RaxB